MRLTIGITLMAVIVTAGLIGYRMGRDLPGAEAPTQARTPIFYRNPMNPQITSPAPAKDHMGMDYIPVYADEESGVEIPGTVVIDPETVQLMGVRTALAERRTLSKNIRTVGRIDYDELRIAKLHPKVEGWVRQLFVHDTGSHIEAGESLLSIYSPRLVSSQQEYLLALSNFSTLRDSPYEDARHGANRLVETALQRLRLLDVDAEQIEQLRNERKPLEAISIHSPIGGVIMKIGAREGQYITPKTELYFIADLSRVWVLADLYEEDLPWVQVGDRAEIRVEALPGRIFSGQLTTIYPYAEHRTRTVKARMEFANEGLLLKPHMFAKVTIQASPKENAVAVPEEAVLRSGLHEKVFVVREPGKFEPRDVLIGISSDGWTEILSGVDSGEEVVVSAQFLIDSESKLREAAGKLQGTTQ